MRTPLILLLLCLACVAVSFAFKDETLTLPLAVSSLAAVAALILVLKALLRPGRVADSTDKHVVIDGSNVMYWNGEVPRLATLREVIAALRDLGYQPGIIFDANAGYKLADRYLDDRDFAKLLNLPGDRVLVVGKGEPADPTILAAARELGAKVVSNDRFRDWVGDFPEVAKAGLLVNGDYRGGKLRMDERASVG